jgi:hypothetical protein
MNKNFAFLTSVPQIPEMPDDLSREDEFCWIVYQMKELNLILQAYAAQELHVDEKQFVSYFYTVRDLLINEMRRERVDVSPSTMLSLKETLDELLVNLARRNPRAQ